MYTSVVLLQVAGIDQAAASHRDHQNETIAASFITVHIVGQSLHTSHAGSITQFELPVYFFSLFSTAEVVAVCTLL
jgi:hypothetical protein